METIAIITAITALAVMITLAGNAIREIACHDCRLKQECKKHLEETGYTYCDEGRMTRIYDQNLYKL